MDNTQQSVLITGANGFVGARLCIKFLAEGFRVIAGVRQSSDLTALDGLNVELRYAEVTDPETLPALVEGVDYVVHNAGVVKARTRQLFCDVNEKGTVSLCKAIAENNPNVKKVIYISSQAAVGPSSEGKPVTEKDDPHPITTYGESKLAGERALLSFTDKYHVVAIRPPGIYGPGDREIFSFFQTVYRGIKPHLGNTNRRLNLVHVDDLVYGVFLALTRETESGQAYFIAEERSYSMAELVGILQQACGRKAISLPVPGVLFKAIAAISEFGGKLIGRTPMLTREKARELLGWWEISTDKSKRAFGFESRISFEQGAKETFEWYIRQGWLK